MSTLSLRKLKHDGSSIDNITLNSNGTTTTNSELIVPSLKGVSGNKLRLLSGDSSYGVSIQNVSAIDLLSVDAVGRMTLPYQVFFFATNTTQAGDGITSSPLQFNNVVHNRSGGYNNSTHAFTAPVAGVYIFNSTAAYKQSGITFIVRWQVNNVDVTDGTRMIGSYPDSHSTSQLTYLRYLAAGDSVRLASDGSTYHRNSSNVPNYFSGYLLG